MTLDPTIESFIADELSKLDAETPQQAFTHEEYAARLFRLRQQMAKAGVDLVVVSSPDAMCWLHGYQSRWYKAQASTRWPPVQCTVVHVDHDRLIHFDSEVHARLVRRSSVATDVRLWATRGLDGMLAFLVRELRAEGWLAGTVGLEMWSSVPNRAVSEAVQAAIEAQGCTVRDATRLLRDVRRVKSAAEIATIERASAVCDAGLLALQAGLRPGMTELEAWALLVSVMAAAGGEPAGIHECVVVGPVALGHAISSRRTIREGDRLFADPCGVVDRYHANGSRHYVLGEPPAEMVRMAEIEAGAFDVLRSVGKAGTPVRELNAALRAYYREAGSWGLHAWTGGYELGISFPPDWVGEWLFSVEEEEPEGVIEAGMVTNFESVIAVSMIDTVVFEAEGARTLSAVPHEVLVV